jgi:hypothetical protein
MSSVRFIEQRITSKLIRQRQQALVTSGAQWAERFIIGAAVTAAMVLLGSYLQELLWALLAGAAILTLGTRAP